MIVSMRNIRFILIFFFAVNYKLDALYKPITSDFYHNDTLIRENFKNQDFEQTTIKLDLIDLYNFSNKSVYLANIEEIKNSTECIQFSVYLYGFFDSYGLFYFYINFNLFLICSAIILFLFFFLFITLIALIVKLKRKTTKLAREQAWTNLNGSYESFQLNHLPKHKNKQLYRSNEMILDIDAELTNFYEKQNRDSTFKPSNRLKKSSTTENKNLFNQNKDNEEMFILNGKINSIKL